MKLSTVILLATAFNLASLQGFALAQSSAAPCNNCQTSAQFGWGNASQAVPPTHAGSHFSRAYEQHNLMYQRNQAWPKPFICWDRAAYYNTWSQMYTAGLAGECTLSDAHFDSETGNLNQMGHQKIEMIFRNLPEPQRGVLVAETRDPNLNNQRLDVARNVVRNWYGEAYASQVALTRNVPQPASGAKVFAVNTRYMSTLPSPTITSSSGSGSSAGGSGGTGGSSGTGN